MVKERVNLRIEGRLLRRTKEIAENRSLKLSDIVSDSLADYIDRANANHSAPDLVLDRMNQLFVAQMQLTDEVRNLKKEIQDLKGGNGE